MVELNPCDNVTKCDPNHLSTSRKTLLNTRSPKTDVNLVLCANTKRPKSQCLDPTSRPSSGGHKQTR